LTPDTNQTSSNSDKPGPDPQRLKLEGNWEDRIGEAMKKPKPPGGWPKPTPVPQRAPKKPKTGPKKAQ
jgi:hypothetical protein